VLEDRAPGVENLTKIAEPTPADKTKMNAKLVFPASSVGFMLGNKGSWIKSFCENHHVSVRFATDENIRCVKRNESICFISGKL